MNNKGIKIILYIIILRNEQFPLTVGRTPVVVAETKIGAFQDGGYV
jgi:hypothetical protein